MVRHVGCRYAIIPNCTELKTRLTTNRWSNYYAPPVNAYVLTAFLGLKIEVRGNFQFAVLNWTTRSSLRLGLKRHIWRCSSSLLFHHFSPSCFHLSPSFSNKNQRKHHQQHHQQQPQRVKLVQRVWHRKHLERFCFSFFEAMGFFDVLLWRCEVNSKESEIPGQHAGASTWKHNRDWKG